MNKEQLIALGLTEEQAQSILDGFGQMIPKDRFDGVNNAKKLLETQVANYETQLKGLQDKAKDDTDMQAEITRLQNDLTQAKTDYEQQLQDERLGTAIKLALVGKVQDMDIVAGLLDKAKIELDEKGAVKGGLDDQLTTLKESKSFLFVPEKEEKKPTLRGVNPAGGDGGAGGELSTGSAFAKELNEKGSPATNAPNLWAQ